MDSSGTDAALTLPGTLRRTATVTSLTNPDAGVVTPHERAPWGRVLTGAEALAARLTGLGVPDRARIGLVAGNSVAGVEMLFAAALAGAVCVPVGTGHGAPEIRRVLAAAAVDTVVVTGGPGPADLVRAAVPDLGRADPPQGLPALRRAVSIGSGEPGLAGVADEPGPPAPDRWVTPDDVALIVHPPGRPGCPLTHRALVAAARALGRDRLGCGPEDVLWDVLPLHHLGFVSPLLAVLDAGGTVVTGDRSGAGAPARIRGERASTVVTGCEPPEEMPPEEMLPEDLGGVRLVLTGGPPETARALQARVPHAVCLSSYTGTGTAGITAATQPDDPQDVRLGTHGLPLPGVELAVADPDTGKPLPAGEPGEILVRGPATGADRDAWFRTGDLGLLDGSGRVHHRGRLRDA